ncbi:MAG: RNA ligase partner protein [Candidatus Omnitrophica bacterium]|nr:RNA ligase partner protein [Candidatus Omnitrophota bacterium]MDD5429910.1 RNA ligase partner protein [Candidatus Omnitrophota bacterium]
MKNFKIILDTSIFVNPDSRHFFGKNPKEALENFFCRLHEAKNINCYMPPSVYEELTQFTGKIPAVEKSLLISRTPPSSYESLVPAMLVYELIEEIRLRINKGLRIAEKYHRKEKTTSNAAEEEKERQIKQLRQEYRTALREGIIDSKEDFDLILLAKEIKGSLATSDKGLITWAQKLGILCIGAQELKELVYSA